jgi:hypothetical protein
VGDEKNSPWLRKFEDGCRDEKFKKVMVKGRRNLKSKL